MVVREEKGMIVKGNYGEVGVYFWGVRKWLWGCFVVEIWDLWKKMCVWFGIFDIVEEVV